MVRIKHRYLLVDILYPEFSTRSSSSSSPRHLQFHQPTPDTLTPGQLSKLIRDTVSDIFGDYGVGKLGGAATGNLVVKYLSPATSTVIIRCPRAVFRLVWAALTYMNSIPVPAETEQQRKMAGTTTKAAVFRVVRVSGTMRKAEEEAIRRARREVLRTKGLVKQGLDGLLQGIIAKEGESDYVALDVDADDDDE